MRVALIVGLLAAVPALLLLVGGFWFVFFAEVSSDYASYEVASAERVFANRWLPEIIPASATRIVVTKEDASSTVSRGEFHYDPTDTGGFVGRLDAYEGRNCLGARIEAVIEEFATRDYEPYEYTRRDRIWLFFVDAANGHARYVGWYMPARVIAEAPDSCGAASPARRSAD